MLLIPAHTYTWLRYSAATVGAVMLAALALTHARIPYVNAPPSPPANLLSNVHWSVRTVTHDGGAVHMLTAALPGITARRLLVRGSLWAVPVTNVPDTRAEMIVIGLQSQVGSGTHAASMRVSHDHVRHGRAFSGSLRLAPGCTNRLLYIAHALPETTIVGDIGLYAPAMPLQLAANYVHAARWYILVIALLCIIASCITVRALRTAVHGVQGLVNRVPWLEPAGWWLLAMLWLVVLCTVFFYYYHPHHIFVNSDDGWNILEIAYHRWHRDGLVKWSTDRAGALFIAIPQLLLETAGLKRWLPHAYVDICFAAFCLFVGTAWLGRSARAFLINGPLLLAFCLDWNGQARAGVTTVSFWMPKIGSVPILLVMLALLSIIAYSDKRRWSFVAWLCVWVSATASMVQSPGNAVVLAVWGLAICAYDWPRNRTAFVRLCLLAAALAGSYAANTWLRTVYDHSVHIHRQVTEMRFNWSAYLSHLWLFCTRCVLSGPAVWLLLCSGVVLTFCVWSVVVARYRQRSTPMRIMQYISSKNTRYVMLLGTAAVVYILLIPAKLWVQLNKANIITYAIPAFLLLFAACTWAYDDLIKRMRGIRVVAAGGILLCITVVAALVMRPQAPSRQFESAARLLAYTNEFGGTVPLLGGYWQTYVHSYFDPHRLVSANVEEIGPQGIADIMLPHVLAHPRVLVSFQEEASRLLVSNQPPPMFVKRATLLVRDADISSLAQNGWYIYRTVPLEDVLTSPNALEHARFEFAINGNLGAYGHFNLYATNGVAEAVWSLASLPPGDYVLTLTARARTCTTNAGVLVMHLMNHQTQMCTPFLAVAPERLSSAYTVFGQATRYPGAQGLTYLRLFAHPSSHYEIAQLGVYPADCLITNVLDMALVKEYTR